MAEPSRTMDMLGAVIWSGQTMQSIHIAKGENTMITDIFSRTQKDRMDKRIRYLNHKERKHSVRYEHPGVYVIRSEEERVIRHG